MDLPALAFDRAHGIAGPIRVQTVQEKRVGQFGPLAIGQGFSHGSSRSSCGWPIGRAFNVGLNLWYLRRLSLRRCGIKSSKSLLCRPGHSLSDLAARRRRTRSRSFGRVCSHGTRLAGKENLQKIAEYIEKGENVFLLSNHQVYSCRFLLQKRWRVADDLLEEGCVYVGWLDSAGPSIARLLLQTEADPQVISLLMEREGYGELASQLINVAGHRVTTDPLAIPFSMGRNLFW